MADLKKHWKQTAKSFILAFNDLGVSLLSTAKAGADLAVEWAKKDNPHYEAEGTEIPDADEAQEAETVVGADAEETQKAETVVNAAAEEISEEE